MRRLPRAGLLGRVVLHGVVLLGVSAVGFLIGSFFLRGSGMERGMKELGAWFGSQACERVAHSPTPEKDIAAFPAAVAVFTDDGRRVASSVRGAVIMPLAPGELDVYRTGSVPPPKPGSVVFVVCAEDPAHYALVRNPPGPPGPPLGRLALLLVVVIVLVAVGSIPLARNLVRPLRELVNIAESFGRGELGARARIARSDEIGDLAHAFNSMAANLHAYLLAEKELLANVSHELRTPLARVRVVLETAREDPTRATALLKEIARDLNHLERLTDDVLAMIRLDFSGRDPELKIPARPETIGLLPILQQAVSRSVEANDEREIELVVEEELPALDGDPSLLLRLLDNLLENAIKYSADAVRVRAGRDGRAIVIEVEDRGIGIERDDLPRIFEPFFRADRGRTSGGSGIGLALCRRIVEVHGGTISARSEPRTGTIVTVRLPFSAQ